MIVFFFSYVKWVGGIEFFSTRFSWLSTLLFAGFIHLIFYFMYFAELMRQTFLPSHKAK